MAELGLEPMSVWFPSNYSICDVDSVFPGLIAHVALCWPLFRAGALDGLLFDSNWSKSQEASVLCLRKLRTRKVISCKCSISIISGFPFEYCSPSLQMLRRLQNHKAYLSHYQPSSDMALRWQKQETVSPWTLGPRTTDHMAHCGEKRDACWGFSSESKPSLSSAWVMDSLETSIVINDLGFRGNSLAVIFTMNWKVGLRFQNYPTEGHSWEGLPAMGTCEGSCELCPWPEPRVCSKGCGA